MGLINSRYSTDAGIDDGYMLLAFSESWMYVSAE